MLDELLEGEGSNFTTPRNQHETLTDDQQEIIKKMFKLFFDRISNNDEMQETLQNHPMMITKCFHLLLLMSQEIFIMKIF